MSKLWRGEENGETQGGVEGVKTVLTLALLMVGCVPRPYSDFQRAVNGATEADLQALDVAGREGGLLLIALLDTDLTWKLQPREPLHHNGHSYEADPLIIVESVGNYFPGTVRGFERFTTGYKPATKVHVVLSNPWAVLWAVDREKERSKLKDGK